MNFEEALIDEASEDITEFILQKDDGNELSLEQPQSVEVVMGRARRRGMARVTGSWWAMTLTWPCINTQNVSGGGGTDGEGDETGPIPQENLQERVSVGIGEWKGKDGKRGEASRAAGYRSPHSHRSYCNLTLQTPIHHVQHNHFSTIFETADGFLSA